MNVLIVAQYFPPDIGGAATRAYNLAKGLAENGCDVTVVAAVPHYPHGRIPAEYKWKPIKVERMGNIKVIRTFMPPVKSKGFFNRFMLIGSFAVSSLFAFSFVGKVDAVWASSWTPGYIYSKLKRCPLAINVDDLTLEDIVDLNLMPENSLILKIARRIYRLFAVKADAVTPISTGYIKPLSNKYYVNPKRIHLVRGGVDISIFKPTKNTPKPSKKFTALYSGGFSVAYDFEMIFKAAKLVEILDDDIEFVVQGTGELLESINSTAVELNVKNVKIVNQVFSRSDVAEFLGQADVLMLPLVEFDKPYLGMSSKLYEYQAVGKPIISSGRGLPSAYVKESKSGLAICSGDHEALAKAVIELKENSGLAQTMGKNGRKYVEHEASIQVIGFKMKVIFETLLKRKA
jgi:glycosyltransferase involved in cell wall biosynthesis